MMVHFGVSSGQIEPFDTRGLTSRGSLFLARPTLNTDMNVGGVKGGALLCLDAKTLRPIRIPQNLADAIARAEAPS